MFMVVGGGGRGFSICIVDRKKGRFGYLIFYTTTPLLPKHLGSFGILFSNTFTVNYCLWF